MTNKAMVTEKEIEAAETLSAQRNFSGALQLLQGMLARVHDHNVRLRLLFDVVTCSTWLGLVDVRDRAVDELKRYPDYEVSHVFIVKVQATAYIDVGRASEALNLLNIALSSDVLQREEFNDWRYEHLFLKGRSLVLLGRYIEALRAFDEAQQIDLCGQFQTDILIDRSNCLIGLERYDEAYNVASQVLKGDDNEMATLAMQRMAECRMWQSRAVEALQLYLEIQKRLPCRLVQDERIHAGIRNAAAYLEKGRRQGAPS